MRALVLAGLGQRFGHVDASLNPDLDDIQGEYIDAGASVIIAEADGNMIGCGALIKENGSDAVARIVRVSVLSGWQGRGLGKAISERLIAIARERAFSRVLVETNSDWDSALRLYQGCGFVEYDRIYVPEFDFTEVHMALDLP
jgi:GNAT superfamily N-acetyltransferase